MSYVTELSRKADPEKLILAVKKYPAVWNSRCPEYKMKRAKEQAWNKIAVEVVDEWKDISRTERQVWLRALTKRWNNIRDYYIKSVRVGRRKKYAFADQLAYLLPEIQKKLDFQKMNESVDYIVYKVEAEEEEEEDSMTEEHLEVPDEDQNQEDYVTMVNTGESDNDVTSSHSQEEDTDEGAWETGEDPDVMFLKSLLSDMKKLTHEEKSAFKFAIMQAYMDILQKRTS